MAEHFIRQPFIGGQSLQIDQDEYGELLSSVRTLNALQNLEGLFSIVAQAGLEIERFLLNLTLDEAITSRHESNDWIDDHDRANLLVLSFLTAVRAYHDQRPQLLKETTLDRDARSAIKSIYSRMFDASHEYIIMEGLRNYAQHARLPIYGLGSERRREWYGDDPADGVPSRSRQTTTMVFDLAELKRYGDFNEKMQSELNSIKQAKLDARYYIRVYLSQLAECHEELRSKTSELEQNASRRLRDLPKRVSKAFVDLATSGLAHLEIVRIDEGGQEVRFVGEELCDRLSYARRKWRGLKNFKRIYISSQLTALKDASTGSNTKIWIPK